MQANPSTALEAHHQALLWLIPAIEQLPRSQKFLLGDRLQAQGLDVYQWLVTATFSHDRKAALQQANLGLSQMRGLLRLLHDLGHLDARRHEHALRLLGAVGQRVGAWRKAHTQAPTPNAPD